MEDKSYMPDIGDFDMSDLDIDDSQLEFELEKLKVIEAKLEIQERRQTLLMRKRMLDQKMSNRRILPGGKIVVSNCDDRSLDNNERMSRDIDASVGAGAGDSRVPALQRERSRHCVSCGASCDSFCSKCGVTPYCSVVCQRRDWSKRHSAVCHNLARFASKDVECVERETDVAVVEVPPIAPLRRPKSPERPKRDEQNNRRRFDDNRNNKSFESTSSQEPGGSYNKNDRFNKPRPQNNSNFKRQNVQDNDEEWGTNTTEQKPSNGYRLTQSDNKVNAMPRRQETNKRDSDMPKKEPAMPKKEPAMPKKEPEMPKREDVLKKKPEMPKKDLDMPLPPSSNRACAIPTKRINNGASIVKVEQKALVPAKCLIDLMEVGSTLFLSVEQKSIDLRDNRPGFVCLTAHSDYQDGYEALCSSYLEDCEADTEQITPSIGDTFSLYKEDDASWYRARALTKTEAALLDAQLVHALTPQTKCKGLKPKYRAMPEFTCLLDADFVKKGDNYLCEIKSRTDDGRVRAVLRDGTTEEVAGEGFLMRWNPKVQYPEVKTQVEENVAQPSTSSSVTPSVAPSVIPSVPRPELKSEERVMLVDVMSVDTVLLRPANAEAKKKFDMIEQNVALYGRNASPLKTPPKQGDTVVALFSDGVHYRALCRRTSVSKNKYLLEYIEYGNEEITTLEKLYPCPEEMDLSTSPSVTIKAKLHGVSDTISEAVATYLARVKEADEELIVSLPNGAKSAPGESGIILTIARNKENMNDQLIKMTKPEWKKIEENGGDVLSSEIRCLSDVDYMELTPGQLTILSADTLGVGILSVCPTNERSAQHMQVIERLTGKMAQYCESELGKEQYLPRVEELCIAKFPLDEQWYRGVLCEHTSGSDLASILYLDYGNMHDVNVSLLRKMLPEFVDDIPALACAVIIEDFPQPASEEVLQKAKEFLGVGADGSGGVLKITKCEQLEPGHYKVHAPELITAIK